LALSLALVIFLGLLLDHLLKKIRIPGLVGMLGVGMALGPYGLDLLAPSLLDVSYDLRMIAFIVILLRAGLKIKRSSINRMGRTALLMSTLPSTLEGLAVTLLAPSLFPMTYTESAILGFVIAAVSPAVVVPSMIKAMERGRGTDKGIPSMILASSSLDNAYVIVVFSTVLGIYEGASGNIPMRLMEIPVSILFGVLLGGAMGFGLHRLFRAYAPRATKKTFTVIGAGILLLALENLLKGMVPLSGLLGVMAIGLVILEKSEETAHAISNKLAKIWVGAEILLFVLVGAQVNITVALDAGLAGLAIICAGLMARSLGTFISAQGAGFNRKEKLFCVISYIPKATVQAAIGAIPLSAGVRGGEIILAVAVLSIIVTAPLGAIGIGISSRKLLSRSCPRK
jgi:NhaP-type Na+/H+ or K+/H+ antiporter